MNRRAFLGALAAIVAAPAAALGTKFVPLPDFSAGDINRATYKYWQRQMTGPTHEAYENLRAAMREIHAQCRRDASSVLYGTR